MGRNLDRRVETIVPVLDPALRDYLCDDVLAVLLADNSKTRWLKSDGTYTRRRPRGPEPLVAAQELLLGAASGVLAASA
jgi:polyphosphate kinase